MEKDALLNHARKIAADAGYTGENALLKYAAQWPEWQSLSNKNEFLIHHDVLSEEQTHVIQALKLQGHAYQPTQGYYGRDFFAKEDLTKAIIMARNNEKEEKTKTLKAKVAYLTTEQGYENALHYAAAVIPWRPHAYRKGAYVAHCEGLSGFDKEVLDVLRMEGHIQPQREAGYYARDYVATGELLSLIQKMNQTLEEATGLINPSRRGR